MKVGPALTRGEGADVFAGSILFLILQLSSGFSPFLFLFLVCLCVCIRPFPPFA